MGLVRRGGAEMEWLELQVVKPTGVSRNVGVTNYKGALSRKQILDRCV